MRQVIVPMAPGPYKLLTEQAKTLGISGRAHFSEVLALFLARPQISELKARYLAADAVKARFHVPGTLHARLTQVAESVGSDLTSVAYTALMAAVSAPPPSAGSPKRRRKKA